MDYRDSDVSNTRTSLTLLVIAFVVLLGHIQQFKVPQSGGYIPHMEPGAADFAWTFSATRALRDGENPYTHTNEHYFDPYGRFNDVGVEQFHVGYPPSHFLFYLPLALVTDDWTEAANYFLVFNVLLIILLAWITMRIAQKLGAVNSTANYLPLLILIYGLFNGTLFCIERGQSDLITAAFVWGGVLLFLSTKYTAAGLLLFCAAALKGYGAVLWIAIFLISIPERAWRSYLLGTLAGFVCFVAPVVHLLPDAYKLMSDIVGTNGVTVNPLAYSFRNLGRALDADYIVTFGLLGSIFAAMVCFLNVMHSRFKGRDRVVASDNGIAMITLVICVLIFPLGSGNAVYTYSLMIILPGFVLVGLAYESQWRRARESRYVALLMFLAILFVIALAFKLNIRGISSAAIANLLFIPFAVVAALRYFVQQWRLARL